MSVEVRTLTVRDKVRLQNFASNGMLVLTLDEVWSQSSSEADQVVAGENLLNRLSGLQEGVSQVSEIMGRAQGELNGSWPQHPLRTQMSKEVLSTLDRWIDTYGGLGEAAVFAMELLPGILAEEIHLLGAKITAKREGKDAGDDIRFRTIALIGLVVACAALAVVTGAAAGGAAGALVATSGLCIAGFGAAAAALVMAGVESVKGRPA